MAPPSLTTPPRQARKAGVTVPIVFMGYYNPLLAFGLDNVVRSKRVGSSPCPFVTARTARTARIAQLTCPPLSSVKAAKAVEVGVDGFIIVDLPPEEAGDVLRLLHANNLSFIPLITPTTEGAGRRKGGRSC